MKVKITIIGGKTMLNNSIVELLLRRRQAVIHIQGMDNGRMLVTTEVDGQYLTGTVSGWDEAIALIQRGVKQIVTDFMAQTVETYSYSLNTHSWAWGLAMETAEYFNLFLDDNELPPQLVTWAEEALATQSPAISRPTPFPQNIFRRVLEMVGAGAFFLIVALFLWLMFTNKIAF